MPLMKKKTILFVFFFSLILFKDTQAIPSSSRSREAIERVTPRLKKEFTAQELRWESPIYIRIFKKSKQLELWIQQRSRFKLYKTYPICTFGWPGKLGPKEKQGDEMAPEGFGRKSTTPSRIASKVISPCSDSELSITTGTGDSIMI